MIHRHLSWHDHFPTQHARSDTWTEYEYLRSTKTMTYSSLMSVIVFSQLDDKIKLTSSNYLFVMSDNESQIKVSSPSRWKAFRKHDRRLIRRNMCQRFVLMIEHERNSCEQDEQENRAQNKANQQSDVIPDPYGLLSLSQEIFRCPWSCYSKDINNRFSSIRQSNLLAWIAILDKKREILPDGFFAED